MKVGAHIKRLLLLLIGIKVGIFEQYLVTYKILNLVKIRSAALSINLLKPTGHVMHQQFNSQELYVLPTLHLCVLYLSQNKQRLVPLTA